MALRVVKVLAEVDNQKGNVAVLQSLNVMEEHCKLRIGIILFYCFVESILISVQEGLNL